MAPFAKFLQQTRLLHKLGISSRQSPFLKRDIAEDSGPLTLAAA